MNNMNFMSRRAPVKNPETLHRQKNSGNFGKHRRETGHQFSPLGIQLFAVPIKVEEGN